MQMQTSVSYVLYARNNLQSWSQSKPQSLGQVLMCLAHVTPTRDRLCRRISSPEAHRLLAAFMHAKYQV
jgi:hypothetical protein